MSFLIESRQVPTQQEEWNGVARNAYRWLACDDHAGTFEEAALAACDQLEQLGPNHEVQVVATHGARPRNVVWHALWTHVDQERKHLWRRQARDLEAQAQALDATKRRAANQLELI